MRKSILGEFDASQEKTRARLARCTGVMNEGYGPFDGKIYLKRAHGCRVEDHDGNLYVDTAMGGGTLLFGHAGRIIARAAKEQMKGGTLHTVPGFGAHKVAERLHGIIPHFKRFVFCSTGSEATMRAVRIARAFTGKEKIAIFSGGWHGSHDMLLVDDTYSGDRKNPVAELKSPGTPGAVLDQVILLPYNDENAFSLIEARSSEIAMVLIEPAQGSNPRDDMGGFLEKLRAVTRKNGILLGFDEIITGFRIAPGGGQEYYGVKADMATYGKALGGGFPIGVVGGCEEVMACIRAEGGKNSRPVFMGGTFSANPLTMAAAEAVLEHLTAEGKPIYDHLNGGGARIRSGVNDFCRKSSIPVRMMGIGSMMRLVFTDLPVGSRWDRDLHESDMETQHLFYTAMLNSGIHIGGNRINFISTAHGRVEMELIVESYTKNLKRFMDNGLLG